MKFDVSEFELGNSATLIHPTEPGNTYEAKFDGANSLKPTVTIGGSKKKFQMTRVEAYEDGEAPSDVSMIPIIMVVMVMVALAFTFK